MKINLLIGAVVIALCSCCSGIETEKYQEIRSKAVSVKSRIKPILLDDILIGAAARVYIANEYLVIADQSSPDKLIHIFSKNNFRHIISTGTPGRGPGEITILGSIAADEKHRRIYVSDHGKNLIYAYSLDSLLSNKSYQPWVKVRMKQQQFPTAYDYISDSLCIGLFIVPKGNSDYKPFVSKWNMISGKVEHFAYSHPKVEKKRITYSLSLNDKLYVECYSNYDLMTICNLKGELMYNIYGPDWGAKKSMPTHYFGKAAICGNKILASFAGGDSRTDEYYPKKILVFDLKGNYIKTLNIGLKITDFCYDKANNRLVMVFNEENQLGYLDLKDLTNYS